jgi:glycosyltransferase involved in cell wall biosynthesis
MPVYNEVERVEQALHKTLAVELPCPLEIVVVDDGSADGTTERLRDGAWPENVRIHFHTRNEGKGAAVRSALADARMRFCVILDADLEYDPADLAVMLEPLLREDGVRAVYGTRAFDREHRHSLLFALGNRGVTFAANVLYGVRIHDLMTCYKAIATELFRSLPLRASGFAIEPEITARLLQRGEKIYEVPVRYHARGFDEGKKLTALDGFRVLWTLLRCRLSAS